ncbi:hypothetical protein [Paenibacillus pabuli]|nr:hypothetical protein [Paenibacillus pabuli]UPK46178.1 hypothetical protein KET34_12375 [Paenibacillus pabuli]
MIDIILTHHQQNLINVIRADRDCIKPYAAVGSRKKWLSRYKWNGQC